MQYYEPCVVTHCCINVPLQCLDRNYSSATEDEDYEEAAAANDYDGDISFTFAVSCTFKIKPGFQMCIKDELYFYSDTQLISKHQLHF